MSISQELISLVKRPKNKVFRKLEIKRRNTNGEYETDWQTIPENLITSYGNVSLGITDVKVNFYRYGGMNFTLNNLNGYFNDVEDTNSFFFGKLSVYRSLVRVSAGYYNDSDTEVPTNTVLYYGVVDEGFDYSDSNNVQLKTSHITQIFDEYPADKIDGLGGTHTAYEVFVDIRDTIDTNGIAIFQKYITSSAWIIETTTRWYNVNTDTSLEGITTWQLMQKFAESEDKLLYIDGDGTLNFESNSVSSSSVYHFSGCNDDENSYGRNVIGEITVSENIKDIYNVIRIKYDKADTVTSYYTYRENWSWGDSSSSFKYGQRIYSIENYMLYEDTAQEVADRIFDQYSMPKKTYIFSAKFLPGLKINDRINLTHLTGEIKEGELYGYGNYDVGYYSNYKKGSLNIVDEDLVVKNIDYNLDDFTMKVTGREI